MKSRIKTRHAIALLVAAAAMLGTVFHVRSRVSSQAADDSPPFTSQRSTKSEREITAMTGIRSVAQQDEAGSKRWETAHQLKLRWLKLQSDGLSDSERDALAKESAEALLCSAEMIELIKFLEEHEISPGSEALEKRVGELFSSDRAAEVRGMLVDLTGKGMDFWIGTYWAELAGAGCAEEEFEAFYAALAKEEPTVASKAAFANYRVLGQTQAETAVDLTLKEWQKMASAKDPGAADRLYIGKLIEGLPKGASLAEIEMLIYRSDPSGETTADARHKLFEKWSIEDPAGALNYVIANSNRLDSSYVSLVVAHAIDYNNPEASLEWITSFPESHRDSALIGAANVMLQSDPKQSLKFAEAIKDPKMRAGMIGAIHDFESSPPEADGR